MNTPQQDAFSFSTTGRAAIVSGITGIIAIGFLITFLATRDKDLLSSIIRLRIHDAGVIIQFILLIPVISGLYKLLQENPNYMSRLTLKVGVWALSFTALLLFLGIIKVVSDGLYTVSQGIFGVWLIVANWKLKGIFPGWLRWFGMVVGLGLALVGTFCIGYAIFVSTLILKIPAATIEEIQKIPFDTPANQILHKIIWIGSPMGVLTLPFWTLLLGLRLLKNKNA
ncbi:hypothetical protein ACPPVU_09745 [Mucilaginibacter sp. McL0603]|uniref:hypothetical protein n=1 Tax=Mucilaginibacter sp. McL0603 TaxID=3415670 RepID=UPI003CF66CB6